MTHNALPSCEITTVLKNKRMISVLCMVAASCLLFLACGGGNSSAPTTKAPSSPIISGPAEVQAMSGPYAAAVSLDPGLSAQWSITGGEL